MGDRDKMDELYQHATDLGLDVEWSTHLSRRRHGCYVDDLRLIVLNYRLTQAQALSCLAHEIGHAEYGDTCSTDQAELRADEFGASMVITSAEYAAAEEAVGSHPGALARELGVTERLVLAWRRWYSRQHGPVHVATEHDLLSVATSDNRRIVGEWSCLQSER